MLAGGHAGYLGGKSVTHDPGPGQAQQTIALVALCIQQNAGCIAGHGKLAAVQRRAHHDKRHLSLVDACDVPACHASQWLVV
jgi:hypothetical protein